MTTLLFMRKPDVYLPELSAYKNYLSQHYPAVKVYDSITHDDVWRGDCDVVWHFMGLDPGGGGKVLVHEYNSLSTQPWAKVKNLIKRQVNAKPHLRVFLSEKVQHDFKFRDGVPTAVRDMGIDAQFFETPDDIEPEWDFIIAGGLNRGKVLQQALDRFAGPLHDATVALIGDAPEPLKKRYAKHKNIIFYGRAPYEAMPGLMARARCGLNLMPDIYPFNVQTATKVLEYCAVGLPVATTDYGWVRGFEAAHEARFFKLSPNLDNLTLKNLEKFDFAVPVVDQYRWERVIHDSGIFEFLG